MNLPVTCSLIVEAGARASLYGSVFIVLIWLVCRLVRRLPDAARCSLWWLTSFKLLLGLVLSTSIAIPLLPPVSGVLRQPVAVPTTVNGAGGLGQPGEYPVAGPTKSSPEPSQPGSSPSGDASVTPLRVTLPATLLAIWAFVVVFRLGYLVRSLIVLKQCIARSSQLDDPALISIAAQAAEEFGIKSPELLMSDSITDPLVCGLFRKVIVFSKHDIQTLTATEFRLVIAHEYAHLRRADLWLSIAPAFAQLLFWWLPTAWLVCNEFETAREAACDQLAVSRMHAEPGAYGRLLLKLSARPERLDPLSLAGALGVSSRSRLLKRRITMLQTITLPSRRATALISVAICAIVGLVPWRVVAAPRRNDASMHDKSVPSPESPGVQSTEQYPLQPVNLDFSRGLSGWKRMEAQNEQQVSAAHMDFKAEVQPSGLKTGTNALVLSSVVHSTRRDVLVSQHLRPDEFRGKRIRFSAMVKTQNTTAASGIWLREDTTGGQRAWNEYSNAIVGTHEWTRHEYVLDVLPTCTAIEFGAMLEGTGTAEIAEMRIEPTDASEATSQPFFNSILPDSPINLNFKDGLTGWNESTHDGDEPYFTSGLDPESKRSGVATPYLACNSAKKGVYGVLTQWIDATPYRGKRVRFSGYVKTSSIKEYGGLMMCVNSSDSFEWYDTQSHPQKGDQDWSHVEYVADVSQDRTSFTLGINLQGRGTVWMDGLALEVVGNDVAVTPAYHRTNSLYKDPQNLDFTHGMDHWAKTANGGVSPNPFYEVGFSRKGVDGSGPSAYLKSSVPSPLGYGVLRQDASPSQYLGKRVRFSANLKTDSIKKYAGLLLVVVRPSGSFMWTMAKRPIVGTTKWARFEYVADIPDDCSMIMFGVSIQGRGTVYANDFKFETVGKDVPVTEFDSTL